MEYEKINKKLEIMLSKLENELVEVIAETKMEDIKDGVEKYLKGIDNVIMKDAEIKKQLTSGDDKERENILGVIDEINKKVREMFDEYKSYIDEKDSKELDDLYKEKVEKSKRNQIKDEFKEIDKSDDEKSEYRVDFEGKYKEAEAKKELLKETVKYYKKYNDVKEKTGWTDDEIKEGYKSLKGELDKWIETDKAEIKKDVLKSFEDEAGKVFMEMFDEKEVEKLKEDIENDKKDEVKKFFESKDKIVDKLAEGKSVKDLKHEMEDIKKEMEFYKGKNNDDFTKMDLSEFGLSKEETFQNNNTGKNYDYADIAKKDEDAMEEVEEYENIIDGLVSRIINKDPQYKAIKKFMESEENIKKYKLEPVKKGNRVADWFRKLFKRPTKEERMIRENLEKVVESKMSEMAERKENNTKIDKKSVKEPEKTTAKEAEKTAAKEAEKPAAKEAEKTAAKEAEKPAAKEAEKPAAKEAEKSDEKESEKDNTSKFALKGKELEEYKKKLRKYVLNNIEKDEKINHKEASEKAVKELKDEREMKELEDLVK